MRVSASASCENFPVSHLFCSATSEHEFDHNRHPVQSLVARQKDHANPAASKFAFDQVPPFDPAARLQRKL